MLLPRKREWAEAADGEEKGSIEGAFYGGTLDPKRFYTGGTDFSGHSARKRDVKFMPWLMDVMHRVSENIPAFHGEVGAVIRDCVTHRCSELIQFVEDVEVREALAKDFQLHIDMEEQARQLARFAEMRRYANSCKATLPVFEEAGNWMLVTKEVERMKKRLEDGLLWDPITDEIQALVKEYETKLRKQRPK